MKKFTLPTLTLLALVSFSCQKSVEQLEAEKKALIVANKTANREHLKELHILDSLIAHHPNADTTAKKIKTVPVTVDSVEVKTYEHFFEVHGNVEAEENAALYAEAPGTVKQIHVKEGQDVKKGTLLISIDAGSLESGLQEVKTAYELANKVYEKQAALWKQKIGSEMQYLQAKSNKESLEQKIKTMNEQLEMYKIRAPFNGIVDVITPKVGEAAAPGFPVARVINLSKVYLEADVSEKYIETVKAGGFVEVKLPSLGETVVAKITRAGNFINPANRTFKVRVEFSNPLGKYKPNQLAVLKIRDYSTDKAIVIPSKIIQQDRSGNDYIYTYAAKEGVLRVQKVMIEVGSSYEGKTEVKDGLNETTIFIDKGAKSVQDGDAIEIK